MPCSALLRVSQRCRQENKTKYRHAASCKSHDLLKSCSSLLLARERKEKREKEGRGEGEGETTQPSSQSLPPNGHAKLRIIRYASDEDEA
jgi:hypothetical protein